MGQVIAENEYLDISLRQNPWHCNGSLTWMISKLFKLGNKIIYAKPPFKPYIRDVAPLFCDSPDARYGTTVVPMDVMESVNISIRSLRDLTGRSNCQFASNIKWNFTNLKSFIIFYSTNDCYSPCPHNLRAFFVHSCISCTLHYSY